jgi:hypothetical protein
MYQPPQEQLKASNFPVIAFFILAILALAAWFFLAPQAQPTPPANETVSPTPEGESFAELFTDLILYNRTTVSITHSINMSAEGRKEELVLENKGLETVFLRVLAVIPDALVAELSFAGEEERVLGFRVVITDVRLGSGERRAIKLVSSSAQQIGVVFVVVTDPAMDLNKVKEVLETNISEEKKSELISLSAGQAEAFRKQLEELLNNQALSQEERLTQLRALVGKEEKMVFEGLEPVFPRYASELQPGAVFTIPVFYSKQDEEEKGRILYQIAGEAHDYASAQLIDLADESKALQVFVDLSKFPLKNGVLWNESANAPLSSTGGFLEISFSSKGETLSEPIKIPLAVSVNHVPPEELLLFERTSRSLWIVSNYPRDVPLNVCGNEVVVKKNSYRRVYLPPEKSCQVFQGSKDVFYTVPAYSEFKKISSSSEVNDLRACVENVCECDALTEFLNNKALEIAERAQEYVTDLDAFEKLFGADSRGALHYKEAFTVNVGDLSLCKFPDELSFLDEAIYPNAVNFVVVDATIAEPLLPGELEEEKETSFNATGYPVEYLSGVDGWLK